MSHKNLNPVGKIEKYIHQDIIMTLGVQQRSVPTFILKKIAHYLEIFSDYSKNAYKEKHIHIFRAGFQPSFWTCGNIERCQFLHYQQPQ